MRKWSLLAVASVVSLAATASGADRKADPVRGKEVFEQCAVCHAATTTQRKMGPSLKSVFKKPTLTNGQKPTDESVLAFINKGKGSMPAFAEVLSSQEKADVIAYLKTL